MGKIMALAEQHARESALHLRHIDDLIKQARGTPAGQAPEFEKILGPIEENRHRLARDLDTLKDSPQGAGHDPAATGAALTNALKALGFELEQVLVGIFDLPKR